jgi:hypothetical protein
LVKELHFCPRSIIERTPQYENGEFQRTLSSEGNGKINSVLDKEPSFIEPLRCKDCPHRKELDEIKKES